MFTTRLLIQGLTLGLLMTAAIGTISAQDTPQQIAVTDAGQCDCFKCRWKARFHKQDTTYQDDLGPDYRSSLDRAVDKVIYPWNYFCHDKCYWHYYITGHGPAIHTRMAGVYWW